jgi:uncharacterized protein
MNKDSIGKITWADLTVKDAEALKSFYGKVVGWGTSPVDMDGYNDYCMNIPQSDQAVAGICHARGANAGLPPQWLIYITVDNLDLSMHNCVELGGTIVAGPKSMGNDRYCVIKDPAGAVCALFEPNHNPQE